MEIEMYKPLTDLNERLKYEKDMLERYFNSPGKYLIMDNNNEWYFEHEVKINEGRKYKLRAYVSNQYPDVLPDLVVCESPEPMPKWGGSHATHTWGLKYGLLQICHWHWAAWKRENLICQVSIYYSNRSFSVYFSDLNKNIPILGIHCT